MPTCHLRLCWTTCVGHHSAAQELLARMRDAEPGHANQQGLKELLKLRAIAQACAADAAPYLHPRLAAVANLNRLKTARRRPRKSWTCSWRR